MESNGNPMDKIEENRQETMFLLESYGILWKPNGTKWKSNGI